MAVNTPFFLKREPQVFNARTSTPTNGLGQPSNTLSTASGASASEALASSATAGDALGGSKLTVGPNIKLKGVEITDCDTLVVEGTVEATMDSRVIHIARQGAFHGEAEVDVAEIFGEFTGSLTVREKLLIHSTGKVSGKLRYGKIVIEEGGQLSGEVQFGIQPSPKVQAAAKVKEAAADASAAAQVLSAVH